MPSEVLVPALGEEVGRPGLIVRFTATERLLHWIHSAGFFAMLASGLLLYVPGLNDVLGGRPGAKAAHVGVSIAWMAAVTLVVLLGNRRALRVTLSEIDRFDVDDRAWLRRRPSRPGRFNAGQKLHTVVQVGFSVLFVVSGTLLWLGERNHVLQLPGTIALHDTAMYVAVGLLVGHLWLALIWPSTRHAMRGITRGTVRMTWAARHHARWAAAGRELPSWSRPGVPSLAAAAAVLAVSVAATSYAIRDALGENVSGAAPAQASPPAGDVAASQGAPPPAPDPAPGTSPLQLAVEAQQLQQAGDVDAAIVRYRLAVRGLPDRADIRAALGVALGDAGNLPGSIAQLRRAARARPGFPDARLYLGLALRQSGRRAEAFDQLRRYLRATPSGQGAETARNVLRGP